MQYRAYENVIAAAGGDTRISRLGHVPSQKKLKDDIC